MPLQDFAKLEPNESLIGEWNCEFPTKRQQLISHIEDKRVLVFFTVKQEVKTLVDEPITLDGTLFLTNLKLCFVSSKGLIFKRREVILNIDLKTVVSALIQGIIFKDLLIGVQKDGAVTNFTFRKLPAEEVKTKINQIQGMGIADSKSQITQSSPEIKTTQINTISTNSEVRIQVSNESNSSDITVKYCTDCGHELYPQDFYCGNCGKKLDKGAIDNFFNQFTEKIQTTAGIYCGNCGKPITETEKFCSGCGQNKSKLKIIKFCRVCGANAKKGNKICTMCGKKL